jgi:XapX domain-containing protein
MMAYLLSIGVGLAVGVAYALLGVRSPAPPIIALLGLLGMLAGETAVNWLRGHPSVLGWMCHSRPSMPRRPARPCPSRSAAHEPASRPHPPQRPHHDLDRGRPRPTRSP